MSLRAAGWRRGAQKYVWHYLDWPPLEVRAVSGSRRQLGAMGEALAAEYLESRGFVVLERNFRCRAGEIDIVGLDGDTIVFVEVKTRRSGQFGVASEQVTAAKRRRIVRIARAFAASRNLAARQLRFDVVAIDLGPDGVPNVQLIRSAFDERG